VTVKGSRLIVSQIQVDNCAWGGIKLASGATFNRIDGNLVTRNVAGVFVSSGSSDNTIVANTIRDNNKMSVNTPGGDDDSGAFGVLLNGDRNDVANNTISGSDAFSYDYVRDGAAVEVYGGFGNHVHHNMAFDSDAFTELGDSRSRDNTFAYNVFRSSLERSIFLVTRGGSSGFGPVANTRLLNNTVFLTGSSSQGFVCHGGCNSSVLMMRNNLIQAVMKAGYADGAFDEDYGVYSGQVQFSMGPHSMAGNPGFTNAGAGDLHLASGSPAIDSAMDAGYGVDIDGGHVPHDGNGDGIPVADRGAFEKGSTYSGPIVTSPPTALPTAPPAANPTAVPTPAPTAPPVGPPSGGDAILVGAGDIAACGSNGDEAVANVLDGIAGTVFTLGDNVYEDGTAQQFADCYNPSWGRHKARTRPAPGNHDFHVSGGPGYFGYFGDAATPLQPGCTSGCKGWYSYNAGSWHVIVLNSECSTSYQACNMSEMEQWLRSDLAANPTACTVAMWHRPVLTIGPHNNDEGSLKPMWRILYDNNVDLVLNGHDHSYARYAPLNREADGVDTARGIRQIVAGTGGKGLTTSTRTSSTPGLEVWQDASTANTLGVLKLTLRSGSFDWQFVPVAGKSFTDTGSGTCH
jgi:parallel beta-helix repeat protein